MAVLRQTARLLVGGVGIGLLASLATGRLLASQLWHVEPHDQLTIAAAVCAIVVVAFPASGFRRSGRHESTPLEQRAFNGALNPRISGVCRAAASWGEGASVCVVSGSS